MSVRTLVNPKLYPGIEHSSEFNLDKTTEKNKVNLHNTTVLFNISALNKHQLPYF